MDIYSGTQYIFIFFVYGLAFFSLGISALQQGLERESSLPILNEIRYLGYFGLIHGITEWLILIIISKLYHEHRELLLIIAVLLNSISFFFLLLYSIRVTNYHGKYKKIINYTPYLIILAWIILFMYYIFVYVAYGKYRFSIPKVIGRYAIGFTSSIITAIAFYKSYRSMNDINMKSMARSFKRLSVLFVVYGVVGGLIVRRDRFFPANIINNMMFYQIFKIPVELVRALIAVLITLQFVKTIKIFRWEINRKIDKLKEQNIISLERRKLGRELHDVIIQNLFATGLQVENLICEDQNDDTKNVLIKVKESLNQSIFLIREYIANVSKQNLGLDDLKLKISEFIERVKVNSVMDFELNYNFGDLSFGTLNSETLNQLYFVVQEAVTNAIKHSGASKIIISMRTDLKFLVVSIEDNGIGFIYDENFIYDGYGIEFMKERVKLCKGKLFIEKVVGTRIILYIPWEVWNNEEDH